MEWIGAVEDATRPQDVMTPALLKREIMLAFEVLDSKIAKGLRKSVTGTFKKASCHRRRKSSNTTKILDWVPDRLGDKQELQDQWRK